MNRPALTKDQRLKIRDIYLANFNKKSEPSMEEKWHEVIVTFLRYEGHDIVPEDVRLMEELVIDRGLADQYVEALVSITKPDDELTDSEQIVHLMGASTEEKLKALRYVLAV
jgi:hypothetical protein